MLGGAGGIMGQDTPTPPARTWEHPREMLVPRIPAG